MPKPPIRPGAIKRGTDAEPERISSRIITARLDLRQAGLFELPPTWIAPAIPTLVPTAPPGLNWLHEIKHDGYRTICVVDQGAVSIYTRRGLNWADRMAENRLIPRSAQGCAAAKSPLALCIGSVAKPQVIGRGG